MMRWPGGCSRSQASASPTVCSPRSRVTSRRRCRVTGSFRVCSGKAAGITVEDINKSPRPPKGARGLVGSERPKSLALRPRRGGNIHVRMHVRCAAEMPHERGTFQPPDIPNLVGAEVVVLIEGQVELVHPAARFEAAEGLLHVGFAIRGWQVVHDLLHEV